MATNPDRDPLEVLAAEFTERLRRGDRPSLEEYAAQHPELAEEIRELFPTIAVTERLKVKQARSSDGRATLGPARLERLGDFRIIREIGRGGMGVVFEAEQESLGRRVALKVLPRQVLPDEKHLKRFEREARIAANLHHTNIVEVFGVGEQDGFHYYVMQYIRGVGLDAVIPAIAKLRHEENTQAQPAPGGLNAGDSSAAITEAAARQLIGGEAGLRPEGSLGPYYWRSVARIGLQAADALGYAHSLGVLHRDIKPANLLLGSQGTVWLTDFGLAKAAQSDDLYLSKDIVGTLRYMPPEQFQGKTDHRSDIYSLGLTLYELLALRPAYEETEQSRLIQRVAQGGPTSPGLIHPGIPRDLETTVLKAISQDASQRYQSAGEMADDLRNFLEDRPIHARRVSSVERLGRWCRRNKALASLAGTSLLLLVLVAAVASAGYLRTRRALRGEALERAKAEANANLAIEALDHTFERLYPARMSVQPQPAMDGLPGEIAGVPTTPILSKETAALLEEMLTFYDRLAQQTGNGDDLRFRTEEANRRVGAIRQRLGQSEQAAKAYQRAIALLKDLVPRPPANLNLTLALAQIQNELGRLFTSRRKAAEAHQAHLAALALLEPEAAHPSAPPAVRFELARTYYFLGLPERPLPAASPRERRGPDPTLPDRRDNLIRAVALLQALSASPPVDPEYQHLLALCYLEGAPADGVRGRDRRAGDERAIEILENLVQGFPIIPDYSYDLSEAYARAQIPEPPIPTDSRKMIEDRLGKSLALLENLAVKHPDVPDFLASEARIHHKLGSFHRQLDQWAEAEQSFQKAITVQASLLKQFPDSPYYGLWMATYRIALADALNRRDQPGEARSELDTTIAALLLQLKQTPGVSALHELLALAYSQLEIALRRTGAHGPANEAAQNAQRERAASPPPPPRE